MTRALFGAGILGVEVRNSDQGNSLVTPGSCGSRLKTQVPQLRMEGMELGICLRVPASHGQPHRMPPAYDPPSFQVLVSHERQPWPGPLMPTPTSTDPDGPGEG